MTPAEVTALAGVVVSIVSAVFVPIYLVRRNEQRAARERAEAVRTGALLDASVTWESINRAIVKERDELRAELKQTRADSARDYAALKTDMNRQIAELQEKHAAERVKSEERITNLTVEIDRLYRRLYGKENPTPFTGE